MDFYDGMNKKNHVLRGGPQDADYLANGSKVSLSCYELFEITDENQVKDDLEIWEKAKKGNFPNIQLELTQLSSRKDDKKKKRKSGKIQSTINILSKNSLSKRIKRKIEETKVQSEVDPI